MNTIDATEHYETGGSERPPSLLTIIIDTNPHAWALLNASLPLSTAIANILVFLNAHLACNYANEVAVVASHTHKATWLYPVAHHPSPSSSSSHNRDPDGDTPMPPSTNSTSHPPINKYRPFREVEEQVTSTLHSLMSPDSTTPASLTSTTSTMMAGALTLALSHINRRTLSWDEAQGDPALTSTTNPPTSTSTSSTSTTQRPQSGLNSRILILSTTSSTSAANQYIPIMNAIFACQRLCIPIDVCKLSGDAVFLQQASDATKGIYMALDEPRGLLQSLMMAFLPDQRSRRHLVLPTRVDVDFRAACFCHRRVVDVGWVCSVCLSIFCEPLDVAGGQACLTCGSRLEGGELAVKPAVVARKRIKKKKARLNGPSVGGTPMSSTPTPGP
ncbi:transcription factor Tfb4 [Aspergillus ellipticus CBS 707.79]|uniref:General transcription and DNA repair factor IIH subunit TFB4 n=1 Tax=Aspergillus ellipticus CBS 707.79 TaxID=1448320 RepID=A0A319CT18_9EURO|nr:transcription factor Tfb4 [Aspergillus ellipticus CBS 707.79]